LHIPDGFINPAVSAGAGLLAAGSFGAAVRQTRRYLTDRLVPMAALVAAFVFAAQMVNFPVLPGMSGHLLGAVLAAVLVGPWAALIVISIVLLVQGLVFADGGLSAIGLNIVNIGVIAGLGGYAVYRLVLRFSKRNHSAVARSAAIAAAISLPLAALGFTFEYWLGGTVAISTTRMFWAALGTHALIGIGEAIITGIVAAAVLRSRPDLVYGAPEFRGERTEELVP
jgi:cobalt/nickel transport system permease protein